jgi:predicted DNA binding CopG/RHH family protein
MNKKTYESSARPWRAGKNAGRISDRRVNFSDIPESSDGELKRARRVGRPRTGRAKQLIAIRIAPTLLRQLRRLATRQDKPYQTFIHELLERATRGQQRAAKART